MKSIEEKVAETLLQKTTTVTVGGVDYEASQPTIATLVVVSELISKLPQRKLDSNNVVQESLSVAIYGYILAQIAAALILGAKHIKEEVESHQTKEKTRFWGILDRFRKPKQRITRMTALADEITSTYSPSQLHHLIATLLQKMDLGDFFALTTFLTEVNLLRQTKVGK